MTWAEEVVSPVEVVEEEVEVAFQAGEAHRVGVHSVEVLQEAHQIGAIDLQECHLVAHSEDPMEALVVLLIALVECTEMVVGLHKHCLMLT